MSEFTGPLHSLRWHQGTLLIQPFLFAPCAADVATQLICCTTCTTVQPQCTDKLPSLRHVYTCKPLLLPRSCHCLPACLPPPTTPQEPVESFCDLYQDAGHVLMRIGKPDKALPFFRQAPLSSLQPGVHSLVWETG